MSFETAEPRYLNSFEAAQYLKISHSMLAKLRLTGDGPPYSKLGKRVIYEASGLDRWIAARTHNSTSEYMHS